MQLLWHLKNITPSLLAFIYTVWQLHSHHLVSCWKHLRIRSFWHQKISEYLMQRILVKYHADCPKKYQNVSLFSSNHQLVTRWIHLKNSVSLIKENSYVKNGFIKLFLINVVNYIKWGWCRLYNRILNMGIDSSGG